MNGPCRYFHRWPFHLSLTVSQKLTPSTGLLFERKFRNYFIVQPSSLKPKQKPKKFNLLLFNRFLFMLAALKTQSTTDGLNLTGNCEFVISFFASLPFNLKCTAKEEKRDQNPTIDEPLIPVDTLKNIVNINTLLMRRCQSRTMMLTISNLKDAFPPTTLSSLLSNRPR